MEKYSLLRPKRCRLGLKAVCTYLRFMLMVLQLSVWEGSVWVSLAEADSRW